IQLVHNDQGARVALTRNGEIQIVDAKGRVLESYPVRYAALLSVEEGQQVNPGQELSTWDPHNTPIVADRGGKVRFEDIEKEKTLRIENDGLSGREQRGGEEDNGS